MVEEKKRIELHCHSKVGGNSTMESLEIMQYLSEIGMSAFAITDESNVNAYPDLERAWQTGKYSVRPIWGMEVLVEGETPGEVDRLSLLVKNDAGKKELYHILSESETEGVHPVFQPDRILKNREGFLIGSGTEKGRLYKLAAAGAPDAKIKEELSRYDYVELLPGKAYVEYNKRLMDFCDELHIPAVAVSDARYFDKIGRKAMEIMNHWNGEEASNSTNHFHGNGEMLDAFSYLPKEKAYEIVVENTHLIANQCETVTICPQEKYIPRVENARERLREKCYAALVEKYAAASNEMAKPDDVSEEIRARLEWELEALARTDMESSILQMAQLLEKAGLRAEDISMRGMAAGSLVVYLVGISSVDPIKYKLEPEVVFGVCGDKEIDIDLNIPTDRQLEVIEHINEVEGISNYVWAGTYLCISQMRALKMIQQYLEDTERIYESALIEKLANMIEGNVIDRGRHPGGVIVFPEGYNAVDLLPTAKVKGGFVVTAYEYHSIDRSFIKYDMLCHDGPQILKELEQETGVDPASVPVDAPEVLDLFAPDENQMITKCAELFEFRSDFTRSIVGALNPQTFEDLVKISALSHGSNAWTDNCEILARKQGIGIKDLIGTRDDVFETNLKYGLDRATAYRIAEDVRKGKIHSGKCRQWQEWKRDLTRAGAPEWYIWSCEQIRYLFPRAHAVSYMFMSMKQGWYMVHYLDQYYLVMGRHIEEDETA